MAIAFIGLGSNLGDRENNLNQAVQALATLPQTRVMQVSKWQETEPIGGPPQGKYLNGVVQLETLQNALTLLYDLQDIEHTMGRPQEHAHWGPRIIDLDLLSYDELILQTPALTVPHPRIQERRFVLAPLAEIAPNWRHPTLGKTASQLLTEVP